MNASSDSSSAAFVPRVTPRLIPALGGVIRLTWSQQVVTRNVVWAAFIIGALGTVGFLIAHYGNSQGFIHWLNQVFLMLSVPLISFDAGARAIREDLKPGAVDYIITRPVPRWAYTVFKYISQWLVIMTLATSALIVMLGFAWVLDVRLQSIVIYFQVMTAGVSAFVALGFLMGSITSRYVLLGLLYAGLIEAAVGNIPTQLNNLSILRHLWSVLDGPAQAAGTATSGLGIVFLITGGLLTASVGIFSRKEFIGKKSDDA